MTEKQILEDLDKRIEKAQRERVCIKAKIDALEELQAKREEFENRKACLT